MKNAPNPSWCNLIFKKKDQLNHKLIINFLKTTFRFIFFIRHFLVMERKTIPTYFRTICPLFLIWIICNAHDTLRWFGQVDDDVRFFWGMMRVDLKNDLQEALKNSLLIYYYMGQSQTMWIVWWIELLKMCIHIIS